MRIIAYTLSATIFLISQALSHGWYPYVCCGDYDCKPIPCDELVEIDGGKWKYLPTGNVFQPGQVYPSQDSQCHVCRGLQDGRSLCAFIVSVS